jgi:hypothetical protein
MNFKSIKTLFPHLSIFLLISFSLYLFYRFKNIYHIIVFWHNIKPIKTGDPYWFMSDRPTFVLKYFSIREIAMNTYAHFEIVFFFVNVLFLLFLILFYYVVILGNYQKPIVINMFKMSSENSLTWPFLLQVVYYLFVSATYFHRFLFLYHLNDRSLVYGVPIIGNTLMWALIFYFIFYNSVFYLVRFSTLSFMVKGTFFFINFQSCRGFFFWLSYTRDFLIRNPKRQHDAINSQESFLEYWFTESKISRVILDNQEQFTTELLHIIIFGR